MRPCVLILFALTACTAARAATCAPGGAALPRVIMIGEDHSVPASIALRTAIARAAARGEYPAVIEPMGRLDDRRVTVTGTFLPSDETRVAARFGGSARTSLLHAAESPVSYAVLFSYYFRIQQMNPGQFPVAGAVNIVDFARDLPLFAGAIDEVGRTHADPGVRRLARVLSDARRDRSYPADDDAAKVTYFRRITEGKFGPGDFENFARAHHAALIATANRRHRAHFGGPALPTLESIADKERLGCVGQPCVPTGRLKELLIDQRDRDFAKVIEAQLCKYAGRFTRVVVDLGHAHLPGVRTWLERSTHGRVRIEEYRSDFAVPHSI